MKFVYLNMSIVMLKNISLIKIFDQKFQTNIIINTKFIYHF
jgi:hypothetical protein